MNAERRTHTRLPCEGKAYLTYDGCCRCEDVIDVSADGLFLKTAARVPEGQAVKVFLPVPGAAGVRLALLKGEVVRRVRGGRAGLAIALTPGEVDTRALLHDFVEATA